MTPSEARRRYSDIATALAVVVAVFAVVFVAMVLSDAGCPYVGGQTATRTTGTTFPITEACR